MANTRVRVLDVSGSRARDVEAPDDVAVNRIVALLVEKMSLPLNSPDGQIMSYKLHHRRTGQQLLDGKSLAEAGGVAGGRARRASRCCSPTTSVSPASRGWSGGTRRALPRRACSSAAPARWATR